jgi:hypothetical protein
MGSRSGMEPLILRARRSFEPTRWDADYCVSASAWRARRTTRLNEGLRVHDSNISRVDPRFQD